MDHWALIKAGTSVWSRSTQARSDLIIARRTIVTVMISAWIKPVFCFTSYIMPHAFFLNLINILRHIVMRIYYRDHFCVSMQNLVLTCRLYSIQPGIHHAVIDTVRLNWQVMPFGIAVLRYTNQHSIAIWRFIWVTVARGYCNTEAASINYFKHIQ